MDATDAAAMAPVQDWHLASLLAYLMNTNDLQSLFSVNNPNPTAWLNLFNGLTALTNTLPDTQITSGTAPRIRFIGHFLKFIPNIVHRKRHPSAQAGQPGRFFHDVGDILAIPN